MGLNIQQSSIAHPIIQENDVQTRKTRGKPNVMIDFSATTKSSSSESHKENKNKHIRDNREDNKTTVTINEKS